MYFVPEGQHDSSQARSAWVAMQRGPRPGGTVEVIVSPRREQKVLATAGLFSGISHAKTCFAEVPLTKPRSVQSSRWDEAIFLVTPGTSWLATISLSLRDKSHSPIEAPRIS